MEVFLQALVNGILLGGFYSLMGMGQNIIFGVMNIVNFCHGEMLMVGMYITYVLYTYFGVDPYVALPIVAVLMFGLGALIQSTLITPSLKTKSFTNLLFLTVGLGLLLTNGALVIFGSTYYKIITPYSQTYIPLGPVTIALPRLVSFLILIVVAIALFAFLKYSTTGKQIRAVSQNPIGAEVVGINVKKIYILTYGLGVALAGIAGFSADPVLHHLSHRRRKLRLPRTDRRGRGRSGLHPRRILRRYFPGPAGADECIVHQPVLQ